MASVACIEGVSLTHPVFSMWEKLCRSMDGSCSSTVKLLSAALCRAVFTGGGGGGGGGGGRGDWSRHEAVQCWSVG